VTEERTWLTHRNSECRSESGAYITSSSPHTYHGGSSAPLRFSWCARRLNAAHARELASTISVICSLRRGSLPRYARGCPRRR
jgi:hypothetical protein